MAKKRASAKSASKRAPAATPPKYPYTTRPSALRKFLKLVPEKPKPARVDATHLKGWGIGDTNALTMIRVLKRLGLVAANGAPTQDYETFMRLDAGPAMLGRKLRETYPEIFSASNAPHKEDDDSLRRLFNIHTGGSETVIQQQLQTFKALAEFASFSRDTAAAVSGEISSTGEGAAAKSGGGSDTKAPTLHIDLHIHLPPDKSSRDYQAIFEDIGRYLMGRTTEGGDV